jgi:hypothetical protein
MLKLAEADCAWDGDVDVNVNLGESEAGRQEVWRTVRGKGGPDMA